MVQQGMRNDLKRVGVGVCVACLAGCSLDLPEVVGDQQSDAAEAGSAGGGGTPDSGEAMAPDGSAGSSDAADASDAAEESEGSSCGSNECFLDGVCLPAGSPNPTDPCLACLPWTDTANWSPDPANVTCADVPYWTGTSRPLSTTPYGNKVGLACHNCYGSTLADTLARIHDAQASGADLIELDVRHEAGQARVEYTDVGGPLLTDVLADSALHDGDQLLFVEIADTAPTRQDVDDVIDSIAQYGYAQAGRPVFLRANKTVKDAMLHARDALATPAFADVRPYFRLHVLVGDANTTDITALQNAIAETWHNGLHGVEFVRSTPNLFGALTFAKARGLGTALYSVPESDGRVLISVLREEADILTLDVSADIGRQAVTEPNGLMYLNVWSQPAGTVSVEWNREDSAVSGTSTVNVSGTPSTVDLPAGLGLFGTTLSFEPATAESLTLYDADNDPNGGYLVAAAVMFDDLNVEDGGCRVILSKGVTTGFSLELCNPAGADSLEVRFTVPVGGTTYVASQPAAGFTTEKSYYLIGAYGGDGDVGLWVDSNRYDLTTSGPISGGVVQGNLPLVLGARSMSSSPDDFFAGRIQLAIVQRWDHAWSP